MTMTSHRRRGAALAAVLLSTTLALTACGSNSGDADDSGDASAETRSVKADNGTIEVLADPQRVVSLGNTTLPLIDMGGKPVGVTEVGASTLGLIPDEQQATSRPPRTSAPALTRSTWRSSRA